MNEIYIINKLEQNNDIDDNSISVKEFLIEFDYATKYLSRLLKVRAFVMYLLLFKKAYFENGTDFIKVKISELGQYLVSDLGQPMSNDTVKKGINDLLGLKIIRKNNNQIKPGQINEYTILLPSKIREVQEMIKADNEEILFQDDSTLDYYSDMKRRKEILKRDEFLCFYCHQGLTEDNFYLDHLIPKSIGGQNYKSNLVASCKSCNTIKNNLSCEEFLLTTYRKGVIAQNEFILQKKKLNNLMAEYNDILERQS